MGNLDFMIGWAQIPVGAMSSSIAKSLEKSDVPKEVMQGHGKTDNPCEKCMRGCTCGQVRKITCFSINICKNYGDLCARLTLEEVPDTYSCISQPDALLKIFQVLFLHAEM